MDVKDRIEIIRKILNLDKKNFCLAVGLSQNNLYYNTKTIGYNSIVKIHKGLPNLNMNWFLFGEGSPFVDNSYGIQGFASEAGEQKALYLKAVEHYDEYEEVKTSSQNSEIDQEDNQNYSIPMLELIRINEELHKEIIDLRLQLQAYQKPQN